MMHVKYKALHLLRFGSISNQPKTQTNNGTHRGFGKFRVYGPETESGGILQCGFVTVPTPDALVGCGGGGR